jgi:pentapeptide repeat protein
LNLGFGNSGAMNVGLLLSGFLNAPAFNAGVLDVGYAARALYLVSLLLSP